MAGTAQEAETVPSCEPPEYPPKWWKASILNSTRNSHHPGQKFASYSAGIGRFNEDLFLPPPESKDENYDESTWFMDNPQHLPCFYGRPGEKVMDFMLVFDNNKLYFSVEHKKQTLPTCLRAAGKKWYDFYTHGKNMKIVPWSEIKNAMLTAFDFEI